MINIRSRDFMRDTILFGLTLLILLAANLITIFTGNYWKVAVDVLFYAIIMLNISIFSSIIANIRRDFALLVFVIAFNVLLLGRVYVSWFGYHDKLLSLLEADDFPQLFEALQMVAISLLCVYVAYHLVAPLFNKRETAIKELGIKAIKLSPLVPIIRQLSVIALCISSVPFLYILFKTAINVVKNGYLNSFTTTVSVPSAISRLSMFFIPAFAVFLACIPNKKQLKLPLLIYGIYMVTSLFTGRRNTIVTEAFMLVIYFVMRDNLLSKNERVLKKRTVIYTGVFGVAAMYVLQLLALLRAGASTKFTGLGAMLISFINSQGASFRVIIQTVNNIDLFSAATSYQYLFYPFERFVHNNVVTSALFGLSPIIEVQTSEFVSTTHNFAHVLTYMVDPNRYLTGGGFGTSYVAEAYVAYGVVGVIVVSLMIGLAFRFFSSILTRSWVICACSLLAIKDFVYIPRNFAFMWVTDVFNLTYLCFYGLVFLVALIIVKIGTHLRVSAPHSEVPSFALEKKS